MRIFIHGVRHKWKIRILLLVVLAVVVIGWLFSLLERAMIYHPTPLVGISPSQWGLPAEEVKISTSDGETLEAWWIPVSGNGGPVLLFFHGNAGNRENRIHNLAGLWRAGISVLIFDYRGYGGSTGSPSEEGLMRDGLAAFDWLNGRLGGRPIVLFGRSLGGAVAAGVAAHRPVRGLILESTFTSVPEMARRVLPLPGIHLVTRSKFDALESVKGLKIPLLVIHGTADELVPFEMGRRIFDAAPGSGKIFRPVRGGHHNDTYDLAGEEYYRWMRNFLDPLASGKANPVPPGKN